MSMMDDPNDVLKDLEAQFDDVEETALNTINVTELNDKDLSDVFNDVRDKLNELGEMHDPVTAEGRELHSIRASCLIEMNRRGWK